MLKCMPFAFVAEGMLFLGICQVQSCPLRTGHMHQ